MLRNYESGQVKEYREWYNKFANRQFDYFARHTHGNPIPYVFNSIGYRGPEHHDRPDISVLGSSFSFGVGIEFNQCWHQLLGRYKVNCYAPAGFLVTNNDIVEHFNRLEVNSGIVILQLREFKYNTAPLMLPDSANCFVIDEDEHIDLFGFGYDSFVDKAEDNTHPGPKTHFKWAQIIKKTFSL